MSADDRRIIRPGGIHVVDRLFMRISVGRKMKQNNRRRVGKNRKFRVDVAQSRCFEGFIVGNLPIEFPH